MVELAGFDQGRAGGPALSTAIRSRKQRVFPVERGRRYGAFDDVVVELDAAVIDEARRTLPPGQRALGPRELIGRERAGADHFTKLLKF